MGGPYSPFMATLLAKRATVIFNLESVDGRETATTDEQ